MPGRAIAPATLSLILATLSPVSAATWYVDPAGSNGNPGTSAAPWATPGFGSKQMQPGDTLVIRSGRYVLRVYDDDIVTPPSGSAAAWTVVRGEGPTRPILAGRDNLLAAVLLNGKSYVRIEGLEITSDGGAPFRDGINGLGAPIAHLALKNLYIHHIDEGGVNLQDANQVLLEDSRLDYCGLFAFGSAVSGTSPPQGLTNLTVRRTSLSWAGHYYQGGPTSPFDRPDGFGIEPSAGPILIEDTVAEHNLGDGLDSKALNTTVRRARVSNNYADGIKLWGGGSRVENALVYGRGDTDTGTTPWASVVIGAPQGGSFTIVNSTIDESRQRGYLMYVQYDDPAVVSLTLRNNIFRSKATGSQMWLRANTALTADRNLFHFPGDGNVLEIGAQMYTASTIATLGTGSLHADPRFVHPVPGGQEGDYHLEAASPAINSGTTTDAPTVDLEGRVRDAMPDRGAYEYGALPPPAPAPRDLTVGQDLKPRVLRTHADGRATLARLTEGGSTEASWTWGPYAGWQAVALSIGDDGDTRLLWSDGQGSAVLSSIDAGGNFVDGDLYGPFPGWTAVDIATGPYDWTRILWARSGGGNALWFVNPDGVFGGALDYTSVPAPWRAARLSVDGDGSTDLVWVNDSTGQAVLWNLLWNGSVSPFAVYGPFAGYAALDVGGERSNPRSDAHLLWKGSNDAAVAWRVNPSLQVTAARLYGPYAGYAPVAMAADRLGRSWLLWTGPSGQAVLWRVSAGLDVEGAWLLSP